MPHRLFGFFALLLLSTPSQAALWLGSFATTGASDVTKQYPDAATGNVSPLALLGGPATTLASCSRLTHDPLTREVWCADFVNGAVVVFDRTARGNVPPKRRFTSVFVGQPRTAVRLDGRAEVAVLRAFTGIYVFDRLASGASDPLRSIAGSNTGFSSGNPLGLVYLGNRNEFAIGNYQPQGQTLLGEVLFFPALGNGNLAPTRRRFGPELGSQVTDLAFDPVRPDELYVLVTDATGTGVDPGRIVVLRPADDGAVAGTVIRQIGGPLTQLENVSSLAIDIARNELLVTVGTFNIAPKVVAFGLTAQGNVAPLRVLAGGNVGGPFYGIVAIDDERLFNDSFEQPTP